MELFAQPVLHNRHKPQRLLQRLDLSEVFAVQPGRLVPEDRLVEASNLQQPEVRLDHSDPLGVSVVLPAVLEPAGLLVQVLNHLAQ